MCLHTTRKWIPKYFLKIIQVCARVYVLRRISSKNCEGNAFQLLLVQPFLFSKVMATRERSLHDDRDSDVT